MNIEIFSFTKYEQNPSIIEDQINAFLEEGRAFKFASQSESTNKGKFYLSILYENKKSNIRAKVFKDNFTRNIQERANEFLSSEKAKVKWMTQSSSKSAVYMVIFYESGKVSDQEKKQD